MIRLLVVLVAILVLLAGAAFAQLPGSIGVFADASGTGCNFVDAGSLVQVYMYHVYTDGATASQFMLDISSTYWMHLGDTWDQPVIIGTSVTGVSIGYGSCRTAPIYLGMANFFGSVVPPCTTVGIVADPTAPTGMIEGRDCAFAVTFPTGGRGIVNPTGGPNCDCSVPVEETTWGGIKALYD